MLNPIKLASVAAVSLLAIVAAGCAANNKAGGGDAVVAGGMMCPECETVWVSKRIGHGTRVQRLVREGRMACPDCDAMARSQLTGDGQVMLHDCPRCLVAPRPVSPDATSPEHPTGSAG